MSDAAILEEATPQDTDELKVRRLDASDRCDKGRCGAQAFVIAIFPGGGELLFCGHHGREYDEILKAQAVVVKSYVDEINKQPSPSANAD
jgi:hypothetical protein